MLDEIDSGLDVDALRDVARRVEAMTHDDGLGVLAITHYARLLHELRPDRIHVLMGGRIVASGGPELADELEESGYEGLAAELGVERDHPREARRTRPLRRTRLLTPPQSLLAPRVHVLRGQAAPKGKTKCRSGAFGAGDPSPSWSRWRR